MKRKAWKRCFLLLLCIVMVCMPGSFFAKGGTAEKEGTTAEAELKHNGKISLVLEVTSSETPEDFTRRLNRTIGGYNDNSGDDDFIQVKDVSATKTGYRIEIETRRIDKVKAMGDFDWKSLSVFAGFADSCRIIENYAKGNWRNTWSVYYEGMAGSVALERNGEGQTSILPYDKDGKVQEVEDFLDYAKNAEDSDKLFMFRMVDVGDITSVRISFPGVIKYYAGNNVTLIDENTLEIKSTVVQAASLVRYKAEIDDGGKESIEKEILVDEPIHAMLGYVVYEQSMSPLAITGIILGCIAGIGLVVAGIVSVYRGKTWKNIVKNRWLYLIVLPAVVLIGIFCYLPMAGIVIAFQDFTLLEGIGGSEWIGLKAFERVFTNPATANYMGIRNTIYISLIRIASNFPVILIFALLLNEIKSRKAKSAIQAVSYIPYFISWIAVGGLANNLFTQDGGVLNNLLNAFGLESISWYNEPNYWWAILAISSLWKGMGWATLVYMSAMGSIDEQLYDACRIDGGGRFRQMITVTLPGISNVIMLQLLLDVASVVRDNADQIMAMTNGSPALDRTTGVIGTSLIATITGGGNYATATALGIVQGIVGLILVLVMNSIVKKTEHEGLL